MSDSNRNHSLPPGFHVRKATPCDFEKVREVSKDAYNGFDDIPAMFNIWLQQKRIFVYVLVYHQDVVSLILFSAHSFLILVPEVRETGTGQLNTVNLPDAFAFLTLHFCHYNQWVDYFRVFPLKSSQISHLSQYPLRKSPHSLKGLYLEIFS